MKDLDDSVDRPEDSESAPSLRRRRLLKAAAAGTPLIATLPSGAAFANASTYQCVVGNIAGTQSGAIDRITTGDPDQYVRVAGCKVSVRISGDDRRHEYYAKKDGSACPGYFKDANDREWIDHNELSHWFDIDGDEMPPRNNGRDRRVTVSPTDVNLVQIYRVDDPEMPTDVVAVGDPNYFPAAQVNSDNTALSGSCLCSVNPDLDPDNIICG